MTDDTLPHDTAVHRETDGRYTATVTPGYGVVEGAPNGGYLTAIAGRALSDHLPHPDPVTITTHYLAPPSEEPVELEVATLRTGGRHSTGTARVLQSGREVLHVTGTFTDLAGIDARGAPTHLGAEPPTLPPPEACIDMAAVEDARVPPIMHRLVHRFAPDSISWTTGAPTGRAELRGWSRPHGDAVATPLHLVLIADSYPPVIFNLGLPMAWAPTLELTVQVRRRPAPGWLRCRFRSRFLTDGYFEEDGEVWDAHGHLVALSRQLAMVGTGRR